jgi:hypothetical protein
MAIDTSRRHRIQMLGHGHMGEILKRFVKTLFPFLATSIEAQRKIWSGRLPIYLDYSINTSPRYGWGKPPHRMLYDVISANRVQYESYISGN